MMTDRPATPLLDRVTVPSDLKALSDRELDVLRLAAQGLTNKEIGRTLQISDRTVQGHLANIYCKLEGWTRPRRMAVIERNQPAKEQPAQLPLFEMM